VRWNVRPEASNAHLYLVDGLGLKLLKYPHPNVIQPRLRVRDLAVVHALRAPEVARVLLAVRGDLPLLLSLPKLVVLPPRNLLLEEALLLEYFLRTRR